jgi:cell division protein FtsB
MDFTTWSWPEWGIIGVGLYFAISIIGDIGKTSRRISGSRAKSRTRKKKRADIKAKIAKLQSEYEAA